jgi:hypothetical protein
MINAFNHLISDIENNEGVEIVSFDDNTIMYEYLSEAIIVHTMLDNKFLIFDSLIAKQIETKLNSYI